MAPLADLPKAIKCNADSERHAGVHIEQRRRYRHKYRENEVRKYYERLAAGLKDVNLKSCPGGSNDTTGKPFAMGKVLYSSMMCFGSPMMEGLHVPECTIANMQSPSNGTQEDFSMDNSAMESYLRNHGVHDNYWILSSVSESESESESEDEVRVKTRCERISSTKTLSFGRVFSPMITRFSVASRNQNQNPRVKTRR
jgi:hypothetical protein